MRFLSLILSFYLSLLLASTGSSQISVKSLHNGNEFYYYHFQRYISYTHTIVVSPDSEIIHNKVFHKLTSNYLPDTLLEFSDSTRLISFKDGHEILDCDFNWNVGDTISVSNSEKIIIKEKGTGILFSNILEFIEYDVTHYEEIFYTRKYYKKFGLSIEYSNLPGTEYLDELWGAKIDGVYYGTVLPVSDNGMITTDYYLSQNYPNPFNPSTTIIYSTPEYSMINLKIFNILGNEIETLINEEKPAGTYDVTWNAVGLPSGVYFYELRAVPISQQARNFVLYKKMILIK